MQYCRTCGTELPENARFCGNCGQTLPLQVPPEVKGPATSSGNQYPPVMPPQAGRPTPPISSSGEQYRFDAPGGQMWVNPGSVQPGSSDADRRRVFDPADMGLLMGGLQTPSMGANMPNVPMVQGTPQLGNVPMAQGTPGVSGSPGAFQPSQPAGWGASAPHAQTVPDFSAHGAQGTNLPPHMQPTQATQPAQPMQSVGTQPSQAHLLHSAGTKAAGVATKAGLSLGAKIAIIAVVGVTVAAASTAGIAVAVPTALSLGSGGGKVISGSSLQVHGSGFLPGLSITFTLDNGLKVSIVRQRNVAHAGSSSGAALAFTTDASYGSSVNASVNGSFDATIKIDESWSLGEHTLHAVQGIKSSQIKFTIIPIPKLGATLDHCSFQVGTGWTCSATLTPDSANQSDLHWNVSSTGLSGISFSPASGVISPQKSAQVNITIPDTQCPANATITFTGDGNSVPLAWSCKAPTLVVTVNTHTCPGDSTNGWQCSLTLSLADGAEGAGLNWTSSSDLPGATIEPSSGTLATGQTQPITILIPGSDCSGGTFTFTGQGDSPVPITWSCV